MGSYKLRLATGQVKLKFNTNPTYLYSQATEHRHYVHTEIPQCMVTQWNSNGSCMHACKPALPICWAQ